MELRESELTKMRWRIDKQPASSFKDLMDRFEEFKSSQTVNLSNEQIINYIVWTYHKNSPFVERFENIIERKAEVLKYLGVKPQKDGYFAEDIQKVIKSSDEVVGKMVIQFVRFENSLSYYALVQTLESYCKLLDQLGEEVGSSKEAKETTETIIKMKKVKEAVDELAAEVFRQDAYQADFVAAHQIEQGRKSRIIPEHYV